MSPIDLHSYPGTGPFDAAVLGSSAGPGAGRFDSFSRVIEMGAGVRGVFAVGVGLLALGGIAVWLVGPSGSPSVDEGAAPDDEPTAVTADGGVDVDGLPPERAREFEQAVNARDPESLVEVLLVGDEHDPAAVAEQSLPSGSQLVVDEATFARVGDDGAIVEAMIVGEQQFSVRLLLVEVDGRWMVAGSSEPEPVP